ncbi:hypothetical protein D9757_000158 [Collybiopsis confluens]|uniref:DUF7923 domain-containing protein n=1 Tax=Collybiopsis confluens TaxID=2823264 RepID=A0A8H5MGM7_9AGAR|nr:hypothetical protein D9757_000158 [Collybiopsis confluens]
MPKATVLSSSNDPLCLPPALLKANIFLLKGRKYKDCWHSFSPLIIMDSFAEINANGQIPYIRIKGLFEQLSGEFQSLMSERSLQVDSIKKLESHLNVYQRAFSDVNTELARCQTQKLETEKQKEDLESRLKGHRVITLIDGDGAIFSKDLIAQGQAGGLRAAQNLSDYIIQHLTDNFGSHPYQLWVYVFLNKKGLMETLGKISVSLKNNFEDFLTGFNQAAERFSMLDVGNAKEAADAKIKCHLEDDIRLPQTFKVIFGGCHDNGYVTNLRSQITAGYKNKLVLLKGYTEMATGIADMDLPVLTIPNLFIPQKIVNETVAPRFSSYSSATKVPPPIGASADTSKLQLKEAPAKSQTASPPTSYSAVAAYSYKRELTPDLVESEGSASGESDYLDELPHDAVVAAMAQSSRYINPNIVE